MSLPERSGVSAIVVLFPNLQGIPGQVSRDFLNLLVANKELAANEIDKHKACTSTSEPGQVYLYMYQNRLFYSQMMCVLLLLYIQLLETL